MRPGFDGVGLGPSLAFLLALAWNGWALGQVSQPQTTRVGTEPPVITPDPLKGQLQEIEGYVPVEGGRLYYRVAGRGPAVGVGVGTPAMLPVPTVPERAVVSARKCVVSPFEPTSSYLPRTWSMACSRTSIVAALTIRLTGLPGCLYVFQR